LRAAVDVDLLLDAVVLAVALVPLFFAAFVPLLVDFDFAVALV